MFGIGKCSLQNLFKKLNYSFLCSQFRWSFRKLWGYDAALYMYVHCTTTMYRAYNEIIHIFWPATTSLRRGGGRIMAIHSDYYPKQQYAFTLGGDQAVVHVCVNTVCVWMWAIGWSDFWRKILGHSACCAELDLKSNIFLWNVAYLLGAGPHFLYLTCLKASP